MNKKTAKVAEALVKSYDLNICDSEFEKKVKTEIWWEVPKKSAVITGYPRYDKLYNLQIMEKQIFFMPTWRNWIKTENTKIEDTKYFQNIANFITNKKLNDYLEKNNIKLNIYIQIGRATSELQSRQYLVCRLLLEKKKLISSWGSTL